MADLVFNRSLGMVRYYAGLPAANDALVAVPLEASGLVADSVMRDYDTLADILAGASNEQTTLGRKTLASVVTTVNDTDNRAEADAADLSWPASAGNPTGAVVICYDPDTTTGTDADLIPLTKHDWAMTPDGSELQATISDFWRSSSAA